VITNNKDIENLKIEVKKFHKLYLNLLKD